MHEMVHYFVIIVNCCSGPLAANIFVATSKSKDACINNSGLMSLSCSHIEAFSTEYYQGLVEEGLQQLTTVIMNHGLEPPEGCSFLDGLEVHVAFGSVWKQSLSGLSGG
ncbi:hypothetical protein AAZX31_20G059500 [Glycine max]